jgi:glucosyl-dolichyl phosphate glucuronosyltransferase
MTSSVRQQNTRVDVRALGPASVAICAYTMRRWDDLTAAVGSVVAQLRSGDECLVVVDYNDELFARAEAQFAGYPAVRVVRNGATKGLSGARNTAIEHGTGGVVAFLDDDALAGPTWLAEVLDALGETDVVGVGTAAVPWWPDEKRPAWFPPEFDWVVGCSYGGLPTERADVRNVIGAAMAFRREVFELAGTFSDLVGRVGTTPTGCEETELCIRVRKARPSARIVYLPDVAVRHHVTPDRLRVSYFLRRCLGEGLSKARVSRLVGANDGLASERSYVSAVLPRAVLRELGRALRGRIAGLGAATLIVTGVLCAGIGYIRGRIYERA